MSTVYTYTQDGYIECRKIRVNWAKSDFFARK